MTNIPPRCTLSPAKADPTLVRPMHRISALLFLFTTASLADVKPSWRALDHPVTPYPEIAKQQHLSGNALFELHIIRDGTIKR